MPYRTNFIDYYELLRVDFDCSPRALELAYHHLAKLYHPDNTETADIDRFTQVVDAYTVLRNEEQRAEYDQVYVSMRGRPADRSEASENRDVGEGGMPLRDADIHGTILEALYKRRRTNASEPGIGSWQLQDRLGCSDNEIDFHIWYLKSKGFIETTEQGTWAISIVGVDHVIASSLESRRQRLLIGQMDSAD